MAQMDINIYMYIYIYIFHEICKNMLIDTNQSMVDFHGQKVFHDDQITMRK
jgi:hypothetical protein